MTPPVWLLDAPWLPVTAPFSAGSSHRTPELLEQVVAQFQLETAKRYRVRDVSGDGSPETFCNVFVSDCTAALGCGIPHVVLAGGKWAEITANETMLWLYIHGPTHGWEALPTAHVAQAMADTGQVVVAVWQAPAGPGHIALVVPSQGEPLPTDAVWIAQAGRSNFSRGPLASGFGTRTPRYFGHP